MHSDRCKISGRTINDWLATPHDVPKLLQAFEQSGWIMRHQNPADSRFWQLIQGDQPLMFGVFSVYEQQLIYDWIAGDWFQPQRPMRRRANVTAVEQRMRAGHEPIRYRNTIGLSGATASAVSVAPCSPITVFRDQLIASMSPAQHATPAGLRATRLYKDLLHR
jgi:hypothetical protein